MVHYYCFTGHFTMTCLPTPLAIRLLVPSFRHHHLALSLPAQLSWSPLDQAGRATRKLPPWVKSVTCESLRDEELKNSAVKPPPRPSNLATPVSETMASRSVSRTPYQERYHPTPQPHSHTTPKVWTPNSPNLPHLTHSQDKKRKTYLVRPP